MTSLDSTRTKPDSQEPATDSRPKQKEPARPPSCNVSMTAVVAGAFAAVTSALIGSRLGTTGTIIGAALGSTIGAVATSLYTWSIQRTVHVIKNVTPKIRGLTQTDAADDPDQGGEGGQQEADATQGKRWLPRVRWILVSVAGAIAAFVVALALITGFENATGSSLSGGRGNTIQHAAEGVRSERAGREPEVVSGRSAPRHAEQPELERTASPLPSPTPAALPESSASPKPASSPKPSNDPTPVPTAHPEGTPKPHPIETPLPDVGR